MENQLPGSYRQVLEKLKQQTQRSLHSGLRGKSLEFIEDFAYTYLQGLTVLCHIRNQPHWRTHLQPLQRLLVQANIILYPERDTGNKGLWHTFWVRLPAQLWEQRYYYLAAGGISFLGALVAFLMVIQNFETASLFMPASLREAGELDAYLFSREAQEQMLMQGRGISEGLKAKFATELFLNNLKVGVNCYILGFFFGIPTLWLLVLNGFALGALPALFFHGDLYGLGAWLLPHGVPEILATFIAGGAGLRIGLTMLNPGEDGLGVALKRVIKASIVSVLVCAVLLIWAALVESFIRQSTLDNPTRYQIAFVSLVPIVLLFWRAYWASRGLGLPAR